MPEERYHERSRVTTPRVFEALGCRVHVVSIHIDVESEKGVGTTFLLLLPLVPADEGTRSPDPREGWTSEETGEGGHVLVVDDRPEVGIIIEQFLDDSTVLVAQTPEEARSVVGREERIDLVFLDIQLGEGPSGIDLLPELRAELQSTDELGTTVPFVAMTAHSLPGDRQRFLDSGFDYYLAKPFTRADIQSALREALRSTEHK